MSSMSQRLSYLMRGWLACSTLPQSGRRRTQSYFL